MKKLLILIHTAVLLIAFTEAYSQSGWYIQNSGTIKTLQGVSFISSNTGIAVGRSGTILKTINGGTTWTLQTSGITTDLNDISFINANYGSVIGINGTILRTTNGGVWVNQISSEIPVKYSLSQNYPNPFNPATKIQFKVPSSKFIKLVVFDITGKEVEVLVNEKLQPGTYETSFDGSQLTSGVYFYKLITNSFTETKKLLLIK